MIIGTCFVDQIRDSECSWCFQHVIKITSTEYVSQTSHTCFQHICTHARSHAPSIPQQTFCCFLCLSLLVVISLCFLKLRTAGKKITKIRNRKGVQSSRRVMCHAAFRRQGVDKGVLCTAKTYNCSRLDKHLIQKLGSSSQKENDSDTNGAVLDPDPGHR